MGLDPQRVRKWASRGKWNISQYRVANDGYPAVQSQEVTRAHKVLQNTLDLMADRTRLAMGRTSMRAFEHCDTLSEAELHAIPVAIALEKHGKNASIAHNWSSNAPAVAVQVNVPMPTTQEREEMRDLDRRLDAFAKLLKTSRPSAPLPGGEGGQPETG